MEDGDTEKYHPSSVIQDFVFSSRKSSCIRCISLQVYNKSLKLYYVGIYLDVNNNTYILILPMGTELGGNTSNK